MKDWKTRKADNGKVYVHLRKTQAGAYKNLQENWGVRFDIESASKSI
ncbi:MAG TPA: cold shock domain-containing protein [Smithellaceae bacterium]|nr:cold shock domain-containing protein [Smithellaceae bacterium]